MARTLRVGGRIMIYVWAMEQKRRKFEKQDIFVPWNPDPHSLSGLSGEHGRARRRAAAQSVSEASVNSDKHRKVRSTSSVADAQDLTSTTPQQRTHRLWFFSRSLDSVFDFGSLAISRSTSRDLSALSSSVGGGEGSKAGQRGRGRGLIKQVSSFFSPPSVIGSEEDVFNSVTDPDKEENAPGYDPTTPNKNNSNSGTEKQSVSVSLAPGLASVALPDLVPLQSERLKPSGDDGGGERREQQESTKSPRGVEGQAGGPCLRYYHVFREGELAELIENHVEELRVQHTYFDHANWCVVAEKVQSWKISF